MDSPWIKFAAPDTIEGYAALLFAAEQVPRHPRVSPLVASDSEAIARRSRNHRLLASRKALERNFWTLSAWADEQTLMDLVAKILHGQG